jgi:phosphocarrier protein
MAQSIQFARRQVGVNNVLGLHLRVAGRFVKLANAFQSEVRVYCKDIIADGRSILSLLSLAAECGTMLALEAEGSDAEDAVAALADLISAPSQDSEDQTGAAQERGPQSLPMQEPPKEAVAAESPDSPKSDHFSKCGPRWDSWRRGFATGPALDRRAASRARWNRGGGHGGG